jgi:hypothetical protein
MSKLCVRHACMPFKGCMWQCQSCAFVMLACLSKGVCGSACSPEKNKTKLMMVCHLLSLNKEVYSFLIFRMIADMAGLLDMQCP